MQAVVCVSKNWGIGFDGSLLFHISADFRRFRSLTEGKTVIYGSRTLSTFQNCKPLKNRRNIILTRKDISFDGAEVAHSVAEAVSLAGDDAIVIGGSSVYDALLPYCDRVIATKVNAKPLSDSFFPNLDLDPAWIVERCSDVMNESGLEFQFVDYLKKEICYGD